MEAPHVAVPCGGALHTLPHAPQSSVLLVVSTQLPLQFVCPEGHETTHVPPAQTWFAPHGVPHAPQLAMSLCVFTHAPLHAV